jgi:uncharacterized repeat protein (TIGR01451 family)
LRNRPPKPSLKRSLKVSTVVVFALLLCSVLAYLLPTTRAQNRPINTSRNNKTTDFVPGELLVRFRAGTELARNKSKVSVHVSADAGRRLPVELNHFGGSELVEGLRLARVAPEDTPAAIKALRARADVVYAEPNFIRQADAVPNDPRYPDLWGLKNGSSGTGGTSAESAWDTTTGSQNVVVGVVDSGIDIEHRDLKDNIFINTGEVPGNNVDDDGNGFIDDVNGWDFINNDRTVFDSANEDFHGTHVAGIIGARGNNSIGVVGVNWSVQIMPLKAIGLTGVNDGRLLEAFNYAKAMRQRGVNLRVLNNSYGGQQFSQALLDGVRELGDAGILFVASAGNETLNNDWVSHFPSSFDSPNVIAVAASTQFGLLANSSNFGGKSVHLVAPGAGILSTTPRGYTGPRLVAAHTEPDGSTYSNFDGTSMAAPHVTGAAALACAANSGITLEKLRGVVLGGVDDNSSFFGVVMTRGRLNVNRTVQLALENDSTSPAPAGNFHTNIQDGRRVQVVWTETGDDGMAGQASLREIFFTDGVSNEKFLLAADRPAAPGSGLSTFVSIPFKHTAGQLSIRITDNVGNASTASVSVTVAADVADPYIVTTGAPAPLTALNSGTQVGLKGDDIVSHFSLPFPIPFYGDLRTSILISTNGALYIPIPPEFAVPHPNFGLFDFAVATEPNLEGLAMIAGMWSDIRTDRNATDGVYMVQPDIDRVIFRWQGVTFSTETPVNFEIELRRDGSIQTRYGSGNSNLRPVIVGISGGDPDAYFVSSHSSLGEPLSLTNAPSVTFALRNPPPPPTADLSVRVTSNPHPVFPGQNITYTVSVTNLGPSNAELVVMTDVLPAGTTFVSCTTSHVFGTCTNSGSTVTGRFNTLQPFPSESGVTFTIVAKVDAGPGTALQNTASASGFRPDPNSTNNSAIVTNHVVAESFFNNALAIAAGNNHTSTVRNDGTVWVWGAGFNGQLGDGSSGSFAFTRSPIQVPDLSGVQKVEDGNGFVYALKSDGTVWAWGINSSGQLGDGTTVERTRPVQTTGLTNVIGIAGGSFYGAAVKGDGTVWVWGAAGLITTGSFGTTHTTPVQVAGIQNVTAIAAGSQHLLMLKSDKTLWSIGVNVMGQLGDGTTTNRTTPVQVTGLSNVARIATGEEFSLALKEDGTVWAWGTHFNGQLGPGGGSMDFSAHPNPVQVTGLPGNMTEIAAGQAFCLAVASDGTIWSWGNNSSFQLGQGDQISQNSIPKQIPNFGNVATVAGGHTHGVALKTDGSVWSWGANMDGALGDGTFNNRFAPVRVTGLQTVNTPSISPQGGTFDLAVDVTIASATPGATIHYTTNGTEPTEADSIIASGGTLRFTTNTNLRVRALKPGLIPSGTNSAQFIVIQPPPQLLLEENGSVSTQLAAVDSVTLLKDPFAVTNGSELKNASDPNTRVILFVLNLQLSPGQPPNVVQIGLTGPAPGGSAQSVFAEDVRSVPGVDLTQVIFRLPHNLPPGSYQVQLFVLGRVSNVGTIRIKP